MAGCWLLTAWVRRGGCACCGAAVMVAVAVWGGGVRIRSLASQPVDFLQEDRLLALVRVALVHVTVALVLVRVTAHRESRRGHLL